MKNKEMRRTMLRKGFIAVLVFMMIAMAACGSGQTQTEGTESSQTVAANGTEELSNEPITVKMVTWEYMYAPVSEDQLAYKEMAKKTNVTLDVQTVPLDQYSEKLNMIVASREFPDILRADGEGFVWKHANDGIFRQLNDLYEKYGQNVLKQFSKNPMILKNMKDDQGRIFVIPRIDWSYMYTCMFINVDFLKQVGKEIPTTIDEFYDVLVAFKGLGKDVIPWGAGTYWANTYEQILLSFGTSEGLFFEGDAYYAPYELQDRTKAWLKFMNKVYGEGLLDQEYYIRSSDEVNAQFESGVMGVTNSWQDGIEWVAEGGPMGLNYAPMKPLKGPYGHQIINYTFPVNDLFLISATSKHAERIMQYYDYMATDEGLELMNWGVKGDTFEIVNGAKKYTDKIMKDESQDPVNTKRRNGIDPIGMFCIMDFDAWAETVGPKTVEFIRSLEPYWAKMEKPALAGTEEENIRLAEIMSDVDSLRSEMYQKFIVGELDIDKEWDGMISKMKQMGIEEAIKIYKDQYKRWTNR